MAAQNDESVLAALEALACVLAPAIARAVVAELRSGDAPGMLDQAASPLGRRRHMAACRARVAAGLDGAAIVGRRHLLSRDALDAELTAASKRPARATKPAAVDELAEIRAKYGLARRAS